MSETGDGSENDVEFGMFGDENYDNEDFGDFGDFDESTLMQSQDPVTEANGATDRSIKQQSTDTNTTSLVDSTLEHAAALLDDSLTDGIRNETLERCINNVFSEGPADTTSEIEKEQARLEDIRLDNDPSSPSTTNSFVTDVLRRRAACAETEPRLLKNLLLVSVASGNLDPQDVRHLLTPLCQIKALELQQKEQSKETPLFSIDEVRSIVAAQEPSFDLLNTDTPDTLDTLRHALLSIDSLIAAKEQELAKKKEDIVTYNQVIQKLIAQASRLH